MIKKSVFEEELAKSMFHQLAKQANSIELNDIEKAAEYLNSAAEIFEDIGMYKNADEILNILLKIADHHTKGLTSEKMLKNLEEHGWVFNNGHLDLADLDVNDSLEVSDDQEDFSNFEDEKD